MSKERVTVDHVSGGQARPYGPTVNTTRVLFEHISSWGPLSRPAKGDDAIVSMMGGEWLPWDMAEEHIRKRLLGLMCGFTEFIYPPKDRVATEGDYFRNRLVYLKKLAPGLWEFQTMHPYTD